MPIPIPKGELPSSERSKAMGDHFLAPRPIESRISVSVSPFDPSEAPTATLFRPISRHRPLSDREFRPQTRQEKLTNQAWVKND